MLTLARWLRVNSIRGADLNCTGAWSIGLQCPGMDGIGFSHKKQSAIRVDEKARLHLQLPPLLELTNTALYVTVASRPVEKAEDQDWHTAMWAELRHREAAGNTSLVVYLAGLERHEYVSYQMRSCHEAKSLCDVFQTSAEKKGVLVGLFSSDIPSGVRGGPPMGWDDEENKYPEFFFALAVSPEEYQTLSSFLEQPIVFDVQISLKRG